MTHAPTPDEPRGRTEPSTPVLGVPVTWGRAAAVPDPDATVRLPAVVDPWTAAADPRTADPRAADPWMAAPGTGGPPRSAPRHVGGTATPAPAGARLLPRLASLATFLVALALLARTVHVFLRTPEGQRLDERVLAGAVTGQGTLWRVAEPVLDVVSVAFVVGAVLVVLLIAAARRAWGLGLQVAVLVAGANLTTQVLKHDVLDRPDLGVLTQRPANSLPSGHTTVAASVTMALVLVVPRRARPAVALLGAAWTAATGVSTLVGQWHRPSDVVAAILVVAAWAALVMVLTPRSAVDRGAGGAVLTTGAGVLLSLGVVVGGVGAWAVLVGDVGIPRVADADAVAYGGAVLGVVGLSSLVFLVALLLRQASSLRAPDRPR